MRTAPGSLTSVPCDSTDIVDQHRSRVGGIGADSPCRYQTYGARQLRRTIQKHIEDPLADFVLGAELTPGSTIMVDRKGEEEVDITIIPGEKREPVAVPAGDASEPEGSIDEPSDPADD